MFFLLALYIFYFFLFLFSNRFIAYEAEALSVVDKALCTRNSLYARVRYLLSDVEICGVNMCVPRG